MSTKNLYATYRIQFRPEFTLDDAAKITGYLARLGVSHLYASPTLQSTPGSTHGYDVVDYTRVNRELGGDAAYKRLQTALGKAGLGQVLDMVPNHMAISPENPWWQDVLENGPAGRFAGFFDVEWDPPEARHRDAVLLPVLGDHYGRVLEAGEVKVVFEKDTFTVRYFDNIYPVDPGTLGAILSAIAERSGDPQMAFLAGAHDRLPESAAIDRASANRRYRDKEVLRALLRRLVEEKPSIEKEIQSVLDAVNNDPDALDAFLRRQNYRLALWRISARELGYRRFFDINTLIGTRMEDETVFAESHALVLRWLKDGVIDGLRIDHPDGLRDPKGYFDRLRGAAPEAWIVVEKILEPGEHLPDDWPVHGTTGYDFLHRANALFVDPAAEAPLTEFYAQFTGQSVPYHDLVLEKKRLAARNVLGSDLGRLVELLMAIGERHRVYRDYLRGEMRDALTEFAACMPVYRTYVRPPAGELSDHDRQVIEDTAEAAKANRPDLDPRLFDLLRDLLSLCMRGAMEDEFVARFQQFTGPVMAKGVEDTTFYTYNRFVSLNEVGGSPGEFGLSPEEFHRACKETQARYPLAMLALSTHDTKRSEDVRARLNVLSEMPEEWAAAVERWAEINERHRTKTGDTALPDRNAEYLFYQIVIGAWPLSVERAQEYMRKAAREAKEFTSWLAPVEAYETALEKFVAGALGDKKFTAEVEAFVEQVREPGRVNSLAQTLLKLTTPGIPDLYQGTELWDHSLVDPDNRRPVDYNLRARLLKSLSDDTPPEKIMKRADDGLPKLWLVHRALTLRREHPEWFGPKASYTPLKVDEGAGLAFQRGKNVVVVVPRFSVRCGPRWGALRAHLPSGTWRSVLTGETIEGGATTLHALFARFPVSLLIREGE